MKKLNISQSFKIFTNIMLVSFMLFLVIVLASSCDAQNEPTTTDQTIEIEDEDLRGFFDQSCVLKIDSVLWRCGDNEYYEYYMVYDNHDAYERAIFVLIGTEAVDDFFANVVDMGHDYQIMHHEDDYYILVYDPNYYED